MVEQFHKIDSIVKEKNVGPGDAMYHTTRHIGEGKIRILALKSDGIARCEYICPKCKKYGYSEETWKRPFSVMCVNCKSKIVVSKMKEQFKREQKAAQKAGK